MGALQMLNATVQHLRATVPHLRQSVGHHNGLKVRLLDPPHCGPGEDAVRQDGVDFQRARLYQPA